MTSQPTAAAAGTIDIGGDLSVNRMGYGAMRITGPGIWAEPPDQITSRRRQHSAGPLSWRLTSSIPLTPTVRKSART